METDQLYVSRFAHFLTRGNVVAAFHSLRMMPVYFLSNTLDLVRKLQNGAPPSEFIENVSDHNETKEILDMIQALEDARILVRTSQDDDTAIEYFRQMTGNPYPHLAYFFLTDRCNFRCAYCFLKNQAPAGYVEGHMTKEVALNGLNFFCRLITEDPDQASEDKTIVFYGGEPLMNWAVFEFLLNRIKGYIANGKLPQKTTLNLVTNGTLLTPEIASTLKRHNVQVSISIDGDDAATSSNRVYQL